MKYGLRGSGTCKRGHERSVGAAKSCLKCNAERKMWKRNYALYLLLLKQRGVTS